MKMTELIQYNSKTKRTKIIRITKEELRLYEIRHEYNQGINPQKFLLPKNMMLPEIINQIYDCLYCKKQNTNATSLTMLDIRIFKEK